MAHDNLNCEKPLKDCPWCRNRAEKLCKENDIDVQELDSTLTFAEHTVLQMLQKSKVGYKVEKEKSYQVLVEECTPIAVQLSKDFKHYKRYVIKILEQMHGLGTRILHSGFYEKGKWGSGVFVKRFSKDIHLSVSNVYYAVKFAERYPDLKSFLQRKRILEFIKEGRLSKHRIIHQLLYKPKAPVQNGTTKTMERTPAILSSEEQAHLKAAISGLMELQFGVYADDVEFLATIEGNYTVVHVCSYKDRVHRQWVPVCRELFKTRTKSFKKKTSLQQTKQKEKEG